MARTNDQKRAVFAMKFIEEEKKKDKKEKDKMLTHIRKTPVRILQNGLGQTLAFLLADAGGDSNKPSDRLYKQLQDWLCGTEQDDRPCRVYTATNLIGQIMSGDRNQYMRAEQEAVALLNWMKKFADAWLDNADVAADDKGGQ
ncbi:MAG: type III-B CRISPR module-associated protein Cmr5 [Desulfobulbus sp.]|nr:type III-B CRISPR module-associated protein Cmr5 [Desulfobulbus sp.]